MHECLFPHDLVPEECLYRHLLVLKYSIKEICNASESVGSSCKRGVCMVGVILHELCCQVHSWIYPQSVGFGDRKLSVDGSKNVDFSAI